MMKRFSMLMLAGLFFMGLLAAPLTVSAEDKNCSDFNSWEELEAFLNDGYDLEADPYGLDGNDNDLRPCENLLPADYDASNYVATSDENQSEEDSTESDSDDASATTETDDSDSSTGEEGETMPDTATNQPALMAGGLLLAVTGAWLLLRKRA
ncbi:hypothetical protein N781_05115 [Pontibacillus halophilus JSM 076056 = DSM 19796]|uniref:Gram-positive cocci surface proteins LPxTG domain-containing protein n=1 Tax=Pontibacillus halophilus JSM 076056 = DSM 19796 TaxID=1385510 RepID=A0A0A5GD72_9BACI|nr:LPXTG cell wall anchor domain-containing protein [Pontibacillus halophilus]KGX91166.1 hypothetical protein N781_05115 [Pontibacillus halophilus JSM 076056 = DSM 19796]